MQRISGSVMRKHLLLAAAAGVVLFACGQTAHALPATLTNANFETDAAADPNGFTLSKTGWGTAGDGFGNRLSGTLDPGGLGGSPFLGENNFLQLKVDNNAGGPLGGTSFVAGFQQLASTTLQANMIYTLSVKVGNTAGTPFPSAAEIPANDTYPANFNNGNPIAFSRLVNVTGGSIGFGETPGVSILSNTAGPIAPDTLGTWTITYQTNATPANLGGTLGIQFFAQTNTATGLRQVLFDDVTLDVSPVPEPASAGLIAMSGMALLRRHRRRTA